jgi:hypothetical protein
MSKEKRPTPSKPNSPVRLRLEYDLNQSFLFNTAIVALIKTKIQIVHNVHVHFNKHSNRPVGTRTSWCYNGVVEKAL